MLVIGKTIGGGIPAGTYGMTDAIAEPDPGVDARRGPTSAGSAGRWPGYALSLAAIRATLGEVLTDEAFERMIPLAERWEAGVNDVIAPRGVPWHVTRLGARAEYHFLPTPPRDGAEQVAHADPLLEQLPPSRGDEPRRADDAVPQHGADVARRRPRPTSTATRKPPLAPDA